jgi:peptidyl-prolyl cis-trans isomerase D
MAVIGRIRQRSGLLIFLIGAAIAGFLIMDATNSQFSVLKGRKDSIGKVNGEKITYNEFTRKYEDNVKKMEDQMRGQPIGEDQRNYIRTQTWNEMVNDIIFNNIYDKLGINVTPDEMTELAVGENASPYIKQQFKNPQTGRFDPNMVRTYLTRLDQDPEGAEPGTTRKQWMNFETMLKQSQFQQKYNNLIGKAFYVPTWQAEMVYNDQNRFVNIKYLSLPYTDVNDADVKLTDDDFKKYLQDHSGRYKQDEETRKIAYVTFDIAASAGDSAKTIQSLQEKRAEFAKGEKPSDDSVFVKIYSETPFDVVYYPKDQVSPIIADSLFSLPKGTVIGPYLDGAQYKLAKISDRKMISDSVRIKDIRISFAGITTQEQANIKFKLIDSIYKQIDSLKGDFTAFALAFSDDEASKAHGGDLGWVKPAEKEKLYNDLIFYRAQKGKLYRVPNQTENAIHLVEVVDEKPSKMAVEVSYFTKEIIPSPETERNIYGTATTFASENQNEAKFKAAGEKLHSKTVNGLKKDAFSVEGLGTARDLVKWAFTAKKGDVSPVFTVDKKHVVAMLQDVRPKGLPDVDAVRDAIKAEVVKDKKFELLSKKISDAKAGNIDELASKLGKTAEQAEHISFSNANLNGAFEPKVAATAMGLQVGKMSAPVEGLRGVYVAQAVSVQEPPKAGDLTAYTFQMKQQFAGKARYAQDVEKKLAKVDDNRFDFF